MLTASQKYAIASTLAVCPIDRFIERLRSMENTSLFEDYPITEAIEFGIKITRLFGESSRKSKDGFILNCIVKLCK